VSVRSRGEVIRSTQRAIFLWSKSVGSSSSGIRGCDLVGPTDLDGQLVIGRVLERRTAVFTDAELATLELTGFTTWLENRLAEATITLDPDPLGLGSPLPSGSATQSASKLPVPSFPEAPGPSAPAFGIPTPIGLPFPTMP
jgi:hypothetical protein